MLDLEAAREQLNKYNQTINFCSAAIGLSAVTLGLQIFGHVDLPSGIGGIALLALPIAFITRKMTAARANDLMHVMEWEAKIQTAQNTEALVMEKRASHAKLIQGSVADEARKAPDHRR